MTKSRYMRWTGNVARMEENCIYCLVENLKESDYYEVLGVDGSIILKCSLKK
jgi:hypothetical protein